MTSVVLIDLVGRIVGVIMIDYLNFGECCRRNHNRQPDFLRGIVSVIMMDNLIFLKDVVGVILIDNLKKEKY